MQETNIVGGKTVSTGNKERERTNWKSVEML